jgi:hypothetical protein
VEKISWTDRVRNEEVLQRDKEERNIIQITQEGEAITSYLGTNSETRY